MSEDLCLVQFKEEWVVSRNRKDPGKVSVKISKQTVFAVARC